MDKKRTWICRYVDEYGIKTEHMATGNMYANRETGTMNCERHTPYLK